MDSSDLHQWLARVAPWLHQVQVQTECVNVLGDFPIYISHFQSTKIRHNAYYLITELETLDLEHNQIMEIMNLLLLDMEEFDYESVRAEWGY